VFAAACVPGHALATETDVVRWFSDAAAPALHAAAPTNDPLLAGRELLNRGLAGAFTQVQHAGPEWLSRTRFDLSFNSGFQPRYALSATQPLLASARHDATVDLHGRVVHDTSGRTGGDLGLRYRGRWDGRDVSLDVQGGVDNRWLEALRRYSFGADLRLSSLEVSAHLYDDIPAHPASREIAERRLDGYELEISSRLPFVPWAGLRAGHSWQVAVNGETVTTSDRLSLRVAPLEIETGTRSVADDRVWFAQLRWRMKLGE
jgi:hypothetical protein